MKRIRKFCTIALFACIVATPSFADQVPPPPGTEGIPVPAGNRVFLVVHAKGTQTYTCTAAGTWSTSSVPAADLFAENGKLIGTHFAGPSWQLNDGSRTNAVRIAGVSKDPNAIAWLLLQAVAPMAGEGDRLAKTTFIHRVNTVGGVAPAGGCTVGTTVSIPYEADYYFYCADSAIGD